MPYGYMGAEVQIYVEETEGSLFSREKKLFFSEKAGTQLPGRSVQIRQGCEFLYKTEGEG